MLSSFTFLLLSESNSRKCLSSTSFHSFSPASLFLTSSIPQLAVLITLLPLILWKKKLQLWLVWKNKCLPFSKFFGIKKVDKLLIFWSIRVTLAFWYTVSFNPVKSSNLSTEVLNWNKQVDTSPAKGSVFQKMFYTLTLTNFSGKINYYSSFISTFFTAI